MEISFLTEKNIFHVPLHLFQGAKVDSNQKLTQISKNKKTVLKLLLFFIHCKINRVNTRG